MEGFFFFWFVSENFRVDKESGIFLLIPGFLFFGAFKWVEND